MSLFLDCPLGLGIDCPSDAEVAAFRAAVAAGDVTWHAFPHNGQLSLASAEIVEELVAQTHQLDAEVASDDMAHQSIASSQLRVTAAPARRRGI